MPFVVVTYNVLATAYLGRGDYSAVPPALLDPDQRTAALVERVAGLDADILCLQEVEADVFGEVRAALEPGGYAGLCEFKGRGKPDGCALFFREGAFTLVKSARLEYLDDSGTVALLVALRQETRTLGIASTHLRWDRPGTPRGKQIGLRQSEELIDALPRFNPLCDGWIVSGDFNAGVTSDVASAFRAAGFAIAHTGRRVFSAVANRRASLIDHLFYTPSLAATPHDPPPVDDFTILPSADEPSDHLPLGSAFEWPDA